jgi:serine/threonine protein kinase
MDFGIERVLGGQRQTRAGQLVGTPEFMAPEQIRGEEADERSDLYSLAILFFSLLSGRDPFRAQSEYDVMKAQVELAPPSLLAECPELPPELDAILRRALAKRAEDRFQTAGELREALEPLAELPTPSGESFWPLRTPRDEPETSLLADTGADPDAPTLDSTDLVAASAPPTTDFELGPERGPNAIGAWTRDLVWGRLSWLAAAGFLVGVVIGLDLLGLRAVAPPADDAVALELRLGPQREPNSSQDSSDRGQALDALYGPSQSHPPGNADELLYALGSTRAQVADRDGRSTSGGRLPKARPGEPRTKGAKGWVIRRR